MRAMLIKIIIWLFEKYAMDEWIDMQEKEEKEKIKKEYGLKNDKELEEVMIDLSQKP